MSNRARTIIILLSVAALLLVWEAVVLASAEKGDTISAVIADAAVRWPIIPFFFGMLMGHFFWPNKDTSLKKDD